MDTTEAPRQTPAQMLNALLPGKVRIGVSVYDLSRNRTYRHVPGDRMRVYLTEISRADLTRLWHRIEDVIRDEKSWRGSGK
jgi:hypothetical protein